MNFPFDVANCRLGSEPEVYAFDLDEGYISPTGGNGFPDPTDELASLYHFTVWLAGVRREVPCIPMMRVSGTNRVFSAGMPKHLLFSRKSDLREFKTWWKFYTSWFKDSPKNFREAYFPSLPHRGSHRLHFTPVEINEIFFTREWVWLAHNATAPVYVSRESLAFTKVTDAVRFKLVQADLASSA